MASEKRVVFRSSWLPWALLAPLVIVLMLVAVGPLVASVWESFHRHDLRMPWLGRPWIGLGNYVAAVADPRLRTALAHTFFFTIVSVALEIVCGLALAMALDLVRRGRGGARVIVLMPWALPTVVAASTRPSNWLPVAAASTTDALHPIRRGAHSPVSGLIGRTSAPTTGFRMKHQPMFSG